MSPSPSLIGADPSFLDGETDTPPQDFAKATPAEKSTEIDTTRTEGERVVLDLGETVVGGFVVTDTYESATPDEDVTGITPLGEIADTTLAFEDPANFNNDSLFNDEL